MSTFALVRAAGFTLAALFAMSTAPAPAHAGGPYSLHLKITRQGHGRSVDLALPWDNERGASPFEYTQGQGDGIELARLREAWATLNRAGEGRSVVLDSGHDRLKASRVRGALVLEPVDTDEHVRIRVPAGIVDAILRHDGRLRSEDVAALLERHGETSLVEVESGDGRVEVRIDRAEAGDLE
jgi:hypothetical protein